MASKLCGQVAKIKSSYTINESAKSSGINLLSAQAGGGRGSVGASKSFQERREALFQPRDFALLGNCQAICLPYDGVQSLPPRRVYLKPHYTGSPEAVTRLRLPQNGACGFPALRSSQTDSQHSECLQLPMRET